MVVSDCGLLLCQPGLGQRAEHGPPKRKKFMLRLWGTCRHPFLMKASLVLYVGKTNNKGPATVLIPRQMGRGK